jgi:predicted permease
VFDAVLADAGDGLVSDTYFIALGLTAALGRLPTPDDLRAKPDVVVISDGHWRRTFGGDPAVIGRTVTVAGRPHTIVAVAPRGFFGLTVGAAPDLFRPIAPGASSRAWVRVVARLRPGVTAETARARLGAAFADVAAATDIPAIEREQVMQRLLVTPIPRGLSGLRSAAGGSAALVAGVIVVVWIVACANVANLLITRGVGRAHDVAVRLSLGASARQAVAPLVIEGLAVVALAVVASVLLAPGLSRAFLSGLTGDDPRVALAPPATTRMLVAWIIVSSATTIGAVLPAALAARRGASRAMTDGRGVVSGRPPRLQRVLIAGQVALSVSLVTVAGLLVHSLVNLQTTDIGYDRHRVIAVGLVDATPASRAAGDFDRSVAAIAAAMRARPDVAAVGVSAVAPFGGVEIGINVAAVGSGADPVHSFFSSASAGYFESLGVRVLAGRGCSSADAPGQPPVVILSARLASSLFGARDPLGREIRFVEGNRPPMRVIGVAADAVYTDVREAPRRFLYLCREQQPPTRTTRATVFVRSRSQEIARLAADVERMVASSDASIRVTEADTIAGAVRATLARERLTAALLSTFALATLALAALGLYGVLAASVARRAREIGVRAALGADRWQIARAIVALPAALTGAGLVAGVAIAAAAAVVLRAHLFGVRTIDPVSLAGTAAMVAVATAVSCAVPLRRAWRVDPAAVLRRE